jgi:hypothetical protein
MEGLIIEGLVTNRKNSPTDVTLVLFASHLIEERLYPFRIPS